MLRDAMVSYLEKALFGGVPEQQAERDPVTEGLEKTVRQLQQDNRGLGEENTRLQAEVERMRRAGITLRVKVEKANGALQKGRGEARDKKSDQFWSLDSVAGSVSTDLNVACSTAQSDMKTWPKHRASLDGLARVERIEFDAEGNEVVYFVAQCGRAEDAERLVGLLDGWGR